MLNTMARNWWAIGLRGLFAVLFGIAAFVWPGLTLTALVFLFGAYALLDGIFAIMAAFSRDAAMSGRRWVLLLEGIVGIAAGILTFVWPALTALTLLYLIAAWSIITGVLEISSAIQLRKEIDNEWLLGISGVISIIFGILLVVWPGAGLLTLVWLIGAYALLFGILLIALAFRLRNLSHDQTYHHPTPGAPGMA